MEINSQILLKTYTIFPISYEGLVEIVAHTANSHSKLKKTNAKTNRVK